jgi:hypothetical protein
MGGGLTTPDAAAGVAGATASGLFNIRPLSIFTCHFNASVARGATIWKPIPGVVDIFFPKVVSVPRLPFLLHYLMRVCSIFLLFLGFRQPEPKWTPLMIDCHSTLFHQRRTVSLEFFFGIRFYFLPSWKCFFSLGTTSPSRKKNQFKQMAVVNPSNDDSSGKTPKIFWLKVWG